MPIDIPTPTPATALSTHGFPSIDPAICLAALAAADAPVMLDIRLEEDVADGPEPLPAAQSVTFDDLTTQRALVGEHGAIVICHKGLKLSAGVTARLCAHGIAARRLTGGYVGWIAAGWPVLPADLPHPDRIALPLEAGPEDVFRVWAAKRFSVPNAELIEVPHADLTGVVERFGATSPADLTPIPCAPIAALQARIDPLLSLPLAGATRPSDTFPILDLAFRGAMRQEAQP